MAISSPIWGISIFILITIAYFFFDYNIESSFSSIIFGIYLFILFLSQILINIDITKSVCGEEQTGKALLYTALPWALIFGMLNLILLIFPSWLRPFSNTIGYFIISFNGKLNTILNNSLKPKTETKDRSLSETLGKIYDNESLLINEIPNSNEGFDNFWSKLSAGNLLKKPKDKNDPNTNKEDLRKLVKLKFTISKCIWFILTGTLTILTSFNYITKIQCKNSIQEMKERHLNYEKNKEEEAKKSVENKQIYMDSGH